jgi:hypothetical protein
MARGHAARGAHGGGGGIQAPRIRWPRLIRAIGALGCAAALGVYPAVEAERLSWLHAGISVAAVVVLAVGFVFRKAVVFLWALVLLGGNYALWLALGAPAIDQRIPIVAAGLLLVAELAYDSLEPEVGKPEAGAVLGRAIGLTLTVMAGVGAAAIVLAVSAIPLSGGVAVTGLGALAAVVALALIMRLAADRR